MLVLGAFLSTSPIRRITPRRAEQGHMIPRACVRDAESHRHLIQETNLRQRRPLGRKVIADEEHDLVMASLHLIGGQEWLIGAAIGIGLGRGDERALFAVERPEFNFHS